MSDKPLIMIVEDEPEQAKEIALIIATTKQYDTIIAKHGVEALEILDKNKTMLGFGSNKIKCILLDLQMPVMNGLQFLKKIRSMEDGATFARNIPIVVLTAYEDAQKWSDATDVTSGLVAGYIKKPVKKKELEDILTRILVHGDTETLIEMTREKGYDKIKEIWDKERKAKS